MNIEIREGPYIESMKSRIQYANEFCKKYGADALAALAVSEIRNFRERQWPDILEATPDVEAISESMARGLKSEPLPSQSYIIRQIKRPEEVHLLRAVYGRQFVLLSAHAPPSVRRERIEDLERRSRGGAGGGRRRR